MARYIPDRNDIVWLDFEPTKGKEIGKYRPALVLSGKGYNKATGLLICCLISTSIRGAPTEVVLGNLKSPSVVAANLVMTMDWTQRKVKKETEAEPRVLENVLQRLLPLIGAESLFAK